MNISNNRSSDSYIESEARKLGMIYPDEIKALDIRGDE